MGVGGAGAVTASQIWDLVRQSVQNDTNKIDAKRDEVTKYEDKKLAYDNLDSIMQQLESSLKSLTQESTYSGRLASSSNTNLVTATASSGAAKTSFTFSSVTQLASSAKITSASSLGLVSGSAPYLLSTADINGGTDYNPNIAINADAQGTTITSGTITINNVSVDIAGTDTMYNILTSINNAGAGVVATFDETNDVVRISGTIVGLDETITFDSGTTNFFAATNIASVTAGTDDEADKALDTVTTGKFNAITDGYFNINNHTFTVDSSADSLNNLMNRVNNSNCGAVMFYDPDTNKVTITNQEEGEPLLLGNDTSGFLDALEVLDKTGDQDGGAGTSTYVGDKAQFTLNGEAMEKDSNVFTIGGVTFNLVGTTSAENPTASIAVTANTDNTVEKMESFIAQFNATLSTLQSKLEEEGGPLEGDSTIRRIMTTIRTNVLKTIDNPGQYDSLVDIGFSVDKMTLSLDSDVFLSKLESSEISVRQLFAFNNDDDGLWDDGGYAIDTQDDMESYTRLVSGFFYKRNNQLDDIIERLELKIAGLENDLMAKEERLFTTQVQAIMRLQDLQAQGQKVNQINAIVLGSL